MTRLGEKAGRSLSERQDDTQDNSENLGPSRDRRVIDLFRIFNIGLETYKTAVQKQYCPNSFVLGHPVLGELNNTNYRFGNGYCEVTVPIDTSNNEYWGVQLSEDSNDLKGMTDTTGTILIV